MLVFKTEGVSILSQADQAAGDLKFKDVTVERNGWKFEEKFHLLKIDRKTCGRPAIC